MQIGWPLALTLVALVALGTGVAAWARLPVRWEVPWAGLRGGLQLLAVSLVVGLVLRELWLAWLFIAVMFSVASITSARRTGLGFKAWTSVAIAMAAGVVPVLGLALLSGSVPWKGEAVVPLGSIIVGNMMTAHTLATRRAFAELRSNHRSYEAYLSLGFSRPQAISNVISPSLAEALIPAIDQTRTVGLVSLPGAYIGVLLGGGSPWDAATAQLLVLVGAVAGQVCTVTVARSLMSRGWLLPTDLRQSLQR